MTRFLASFAARRLAPALLGLFLAGPAFGQAVASQGDLARLYTQFGTLSSVQAEVQRGGSTLHLTYSIQP